MKTSLNLNNKRKMYVQIDREIGSDEMFALLDEVNSDLEDDTENLMSDQDTEFVLEESLERGLDFDDEPSNSPEANCHVTENPTIEKILEEGSRNKENSKKKRKSETKWQRKKK